MSSKFNKKCIICLNRVRSKKKIQEPTDDDKHQVLVTYLFRKLAWTPLTGTEFEEYLRIGRTSLWAPLCHICEEQIQQALGKHKGVERLLREIDGIRRKLFSETFYETESEDDDDDEGKLGGTPKKGGKEAYVRLRQRLADDSVESQGNPNLFYKSVVIRYKGKGSEGDTGGYRDVDSDHDSIEVKQEVELDSGDDSVDYYDGGDDDDRLFDGSQQYSTNSEKQALTTPSNRGPPVKKPPKESTTPRRKRRRLSGLSDSSSIPFEDDSDDNDYEPQSDSDDSIKNSGRGNTRKEVASGVIDEEEDVNIPTLEEAVRMVAESGCPKCPVCHNEFSNRSHVKRHYRESHLKQKRFKCEACNNTFTRMAYLTKHYLLSHPDFTPSEATRGNTSSKTTENPENIEPPPLKVALEMSAESKGRQCPVCQKEFTSRRNMVRHYRETHLKEREKRCDECGSTFKRREYLVDHIKLRHPEKYAAFTARNELKWRCRYPCCSEILPTKSALQEHAKKMHRFNPRAFACDVCEKRFAKMDDLVKHRSSSHGIEAGKELEDQTCPECSKVFASDIAVKKHIERYHTKKDSFMCESCGTPFNTMDTLKRHVLSKHRSVS